MDAKHYKVLFEGKILPGNDEDSVKERLKTLFHADDSLISRLFSGKSYAIRKNIPKKEARKYEKAIMQAGGQCRIVAMDSSWKLEPIEKGLTKAGTSGKSPLTRINSRFRKDPSKPFRLIGRIGRCQFNSLCWLAMVIEAVAFLLPMYLPTIQQTSTVTTGLHALAILISVYAMIARLHDLNRSGSKWLFVVIPIVNLMFMSWLSFAKGTKGSNAYGEPPAKPGRFVRLLGFYIPAGIVLGAAAGIYLYQNELLNLIQQLPAGLSKQIPGDVGGYLPFLSL
ncbi:DUF805 domain-containing protein [Endozoicomonas lisbonensis]|uniref:Uncharacterized membrane protein YhaH (DUF805 family) n=1 Tax=Endozoicomonas lisbonensis TaxID=3120522 RepID=A0ABV2SK56_9GAMM